MKFLYYLLEIPLIAAAVWIIVNAHAGEDAFTVELWPLESEIQINTKLTLCAIMLFGFIWAKINSWFAYSPLRKALRSQKKANKVLNKEQEKLNETVTGLQKNIVGLQEKAKMHELIASRENANSQVKQKVSSLGSKISSLFKNKKEN